MPQASIFGKLARRSWIFVVLAGLLIAAVAAPMAGAHHRPGHGGSGGGAQPGDGLLTIPISGTFEDLLGEGTFEGTYTIQRFVVEDGVLYAVGTLAGTLTDALGGTTDVFERNVQLPVDLGNSTATCDILFLQLGPLDLDLLGLVIHLDQITLEITAEAGPGNLLGNLLCAVAGLLDGGLSLNLVADLLNVIVDLLNELGLG
jgi:hypothetical protein